VIVYGTEIEQEQLSKDGS